MRTGRFADADAGGVVDRRGDGGRDAGQADFADAAGAVLAHEGSGMSRKWTSMLRGSRRWSERCSRRSYR